MVGVSITQGYSTSVVGVMFDGDQPPPDTMPHYIQSVSSYGGQGQSAGISGAAVCFPAGTLIETPDGPSQIETLMRAEYLHLMLDSHQMVFSEEIAAESLFHGAMAQDALGSGAQHEGFENDSCNILNYCE